MKYLSLVRTSWAAAAVVALILIPCSRAAAQQGLTWDQVKDRFEANNPTLKSDQANVDEMRAQEITAGLRPNPQFSLTVDGTQIAPNNGVWQPLAGTFFVPSISYLHERDHKRELRVQSAREGTDIAASQHVDLERTMLFTLRSAFVQVLQAKSVVELSKQELDYYDHIVDISHERWIKGDLAEVDFERVELQRVQYESDLQTAEVNLRTAKIQLLQLLDDRTPIDQFDVNGPFDFVDQLQTLDALRQIALDHRPDLRAALESLQQADTNHKLAIANGSTDPTFGGWYTWNASTNNPNADQTLGLSVSVPLRIFDRNQGEKLRTQIDITRNQHLADASRAQVFSDVDSAYAQVDSNLVLLRHYKAKYLAEALHVRETVTYAWQHGGASLMDFLNAQSDYRNVQLAYLQLVGAYLTAAGQLNMAVGQEVIQP